MVPSERIRESVAAGSFYPADPDGLRRLIEGFLYDAGSSDLKNIKGIVCPHAGYIYSGQVAAYSYRQIADDKFDSIFLIGPSHTEYFNFSSIYSGDAYMTPLGLVYVDKERSKKLAGKSESIKLSLYGHKDEHSLEVQLPFLQVLFEDMKIVPIVIGQQSSQNIKELGESIGELFKNENILIVASTDLSHYHPYNTAVILDQKVEKLINDYDPEALMTEFINDNVEMCGGGPVISTIIASTILGADTAKILDYKNSGDVSGDKSAVVGYLSAAFYKK
jgi:AmmeMemoRadiSam system protein B